MQLELAKQSQPTGHTCGVEGNVEIVEMTVDPEVTGEWGPRWAPSFARLRIARPRKRPVKVVDEFTRTASPDKRIRLTLGIQEVVLELGSPG